MQEIIIKKINFRSFLKLFILMGLSCGVIIGLLSFIMIGLFGNGKADINGTTYYGLLGGTISLLMSPFISTIISLFLGIFAYLPFIVLIKVLKEVSIYGEFEEVNRGDIDVE